MYSVFSNVRTIRDFFRSLKWALVDSIYSITFQYLLTVTIPNAAGLTCCSTAGTLPLMPIFPTF